jgi:hypothetical protein
MRLSFFVLAKSLLCGFDYRHMRKYYHLLLFYAI